MIFWSWRRRKNNFQGWCFAPLRGIGIFKATKHHVDHDVIRSAADLVETGHVLFNAMLESAAVWFCLLRKLFFSTRMTQDDAGFRRYSNMTLTI